MCALFLLLTAHQVQVAAQEGRPGLVTFTLIRGGDAEGVFETFENSRACLRDVMPQGVQYDDVAFHEGNVPLDAQIALRQKLCAHLASLGTPCRSSFASVRSSVQICNSWTLEIMEASVLKLHRRS